MSYEQTNIETRPRFDQILSDEDRDYVIAGLKMIREELLTAPEKDFPDTIVFLDTGARPLAYGVLPIVKDAAERRGLSVPENRFLAAVSRTEDLSKILEARESGDPDWKHNLIERMVEKEERYERERLVAKRKLMEETKSEGRESAMLRQEIEGAEKDLKEAGPRVRHYTSPHRQDSKLWINRWYPSPPFLGG